MLFSVINLKVLLNVYITTDFMLIADNPLKTILMLYYILYALYKHMNFLRVAKMSISLIKQLKI